jgi:hypothetical protein
MHFLLLVLGRKETFNIGSRHRRISAVDKISCSIGDAVKTTGICRSRIYELIGEKRIDARKVGRSTLIMVESLRRLLNEAPTVAEVTDPVVGVVRRHHSKRVVATATA